MPKQVFSVPLICTAFNVLLFNNHGSADILGGKHRLYVFAEAPLTSIDPCSYTAGLLCVVGTAVSASR